MRELRERAGQIVKGVCLILAIVVVCQLAGVVSRWNPFRSVTVPELPVLASATNSPAEGTPKTNHVAATAAKGTNGAANGKTPGLPHVGSYKYGGHQPQPVAASSKTNSVTNSVAAATSSAKALPRSSKPKPPWRNEWDDQRGGGQPPHVGAYKCGGYERSDYYGDQWRDQRVAASFLTSAPTNAAMLSTNQVTNLVVSAAAGTNALAASGTNAAAAKLRRHQPGGPPMPGMAGKHGADLPPAVQARIQQITDSELLAR